MVDREEQLEDAFRRFYRPLLRFFFARGFSREAAEDLAQETFVRAGLNSPLPQDEESVGPRLFQVARYVWLDSLRMRRAQKRSAVTSSLDDVLDIHSIFDPSEKGPVEALLESESRQRLEAALAALPPKMRHCMLLRLVQGFSYGEIAALQRISVDAVKSHLHQARQRLRQELQREFRVEDFG